MNNLTQTSEARPRCGSDSELLAHWRPSNQFVSSDGLAMPAVDLQLPDGSFFRDSVFTAWGDSRRVHAGFLRVRPGERGQSKGREMVRGLGALAHKYDFSELSVGLASQYSLDIFASVFGMDRMTLFGLESGGRDISAMLQGEPKKWLDIGFDEARAELVALEKDEKDLEDRQLGFYTMIGLRGLDMSNWGLPEECYHDQVDIESIRPKVVPNP